MCNSENSGSTAPYPIVRTHCAYDGLDPIDDITFAFFKSDALEEEEYFIQNKLRGDICAEESWLAYNDDDANCLTPCVPASGNECELWTQDFNRGTILQVNAANKKIFLIHKNEVFIPGVVSCHYYTIKTVGATGTCMGTTPHWLTAVDVNENAEDLYLMPISTNSFAKKNAAWNLPAFTGPGDTASCPANWLI